MTENFNVLTFTELVTEWERELEGLSERMTARIRGVSDDSEPDQDVLTRLSTALAVEIGALHSHVVLLGQVVRQLVDHTGLESTSSAEPE